MAEENIESKKVPIKFGVSKIKLLSSDWYISEIFNPKKDSKIQFQIDTTFEELDDLKEVGITIEYNFYHNNSKIYSLKTYNSFVMPDASYESFSNSNMNLKQRFLKHITSIAVHHSRALQSTVENQSDISKVRFPILTRDQLDKITTPEDEDVENTEDF